MLFKNLLPSLVALGCVLGATASPQVTTAIPFGVVDDSGDISGSPTGDDDEVVSGVIVGSGPDGTTYVLSVPATATDDSAYTVTLVENASAVSAVVAVSEEGVVATESIGCGFNSDGSAVCTMQIVQGDGTSTFTDAITTSGSVAMATFVVSTSSASGSSSPTASDSASTSGSSQSSGAGKNIAVGALAGALPLLAAVALA